MTLSSPAAAPRRGYPLAARVSAALLGTLLLSGCGISDWFSGEDDGPSLPGNRISVLQLQQALEPDPSVAQQAVTLPEPVVNTDWAQPGGIPTHTMGNVALPATLKEAWRTSISGSESDNRLLSGPVVAQGRVYVLDTDFDLHAIDEATGRKIWTANMLREDQSGDALGGGVTFHDGRLYVTTGFGEVVCVEAADGKVIWRQRIAGPIRSAPTVADGRVFVVTIDNQFVVLNAENRVLQWVHTGILETAALLGGASAAVDGDQVYVPYSSGELFALRVENGRLTWQDVLATTRRGENLAGLSDIRGLLVADRGLVFAISHSGRMVAIDQRSGQRVWEQDIGGINTPWVAGDWIFVISNEAQLIALTRDGGRVRWISQLEQYEDPDDREDPIQWTGPILAGGRLILANNLGELVEVQPDSGQVIRRTDLPDAVLVPPVVANNTLFVLTDDGDLIAYR
ncbi:PQQ-like beta-propeller repeat protein [Rhodocista pekingensis]|uniref:PQQ-binding-like beta-propeller repeat protein n=1 Tax=Rhodocista pekingensis TaxID=201185 RepID=A0ABW2KS91_9PROT